MAEVRANVSGAPLPPDFIGTPQALWDAMLSRLRVTIDGATFVVGDTQPTANEGPWLRGGREWMVWDAVTGTYVPLDVTNSTVPDVYIGPTPPDSSTPPFPQVWVKIEGSAMVGIYYYAGLVDNEPSWVTMTKELGSETVKGEHIATGALLPRHFSNSSMPPSALPENILLAKLERGTPNQTVTMDKNGVKAEWRSPVLVSPAIEFTAKQWVYTWDHGLGKVPVWFRAVLVAKKATSTGWAKDEELDLMMCAGPGPTDDWNNLAALMCNSERVHLRLCKGLQVPTRGPATGDPASWGKVQYSMDVMIEGYPPDLPTITTDFYLKFYVGCW